MAERARRREAAAVLRIRGLHVYYGQSHALQGIDLDLAHGVVSVVGRNGMGKTTLCNAIMGLVPVARGSIQFEGDELAGSNPSRIAHHGVGYVPQGRRLWPSLTVDEHLRLCERGARGGWTRERIYDAFPRLAERRTSRGGQLSGGEQQMLAIARALLLNPRLLVMDEPTEGLAPVIVQQVEDMLIRIGEEGEVSVLVIEQNIGVATAVSDDVAIMVNGRIHRIMDAAALAADRDLQQRLLGVGRHGEDESGPGGTGDAVGAGGAGRAGRASGAGGGAGVPGASAPETPALRLVSGHGAGRIWMSNPEPPTRWSKPVPVADYESAAADLAGSRRLRGAGGLHDADGARYTGGARDADGVRYTDGARHADGPHPRGVPRAGGVRRAAGGGPLRPLSPEGDPVVLVIGTFDTKGAELKFVRDRIVEAGQRVKLVDVSTSGRPSAADVPPHQIAACHPKGPNAVFTNDRGTAVREMALALERWMSRQPGVSGVFSAGGSGGASLAAPAMQALPVGVPKIMVTTVASGDVSRYVGASDIMMLYSVTDVQGLNAISRKVLANGAHALAGMVANRGDETSARARARAGARTTARQERPAIGLTMFGVTTPCVRQVCARLEDRYDCLVFHATGTGGRSMEKLLDSGELAGVLDVTTTEVCDMMMGGVFPATEDRFGAVIRTRAPYVGACGALDMVNFGPRESVPERYRSRNLHEHNPQVTLMRTTAEENDRMGRWIGARLNLMDGPVRFLLPEGGVSQLDAPGMAFHDPGARAALFGALEETVRQTGTRQLVRLPHHVNDPAFADALATAFETVAGVRAARARGGR